MTSATSDSKRRISSLPRDVRATLLARRCASSIPISTKPSSMSICTCCRVVIGEVAAAFNTRRRSQAPPSRLMMRRIVNDSRLLKENRRSLMPSIASSSSAFSGLITNPSVPDFGQFLMSG